MADWVGWHTAYESDTPLARRLVAVQEQVALALNRAAPRPVRLLCPATTFTLQPAQRLGVAS